MNSIKSDECSYLSVNARQDTSPFKTWSWKPTETAKMKKWVAAEMRGMNSSAYCIKDTKTRCYNNDSINTCKTITVPVERPILTMWCNKKQPSILQLQHINYFFFLCQSCNSNNMEISIFGVDSISMGSFCDNKPLYFSSSLCTNLSKEVYKVKNVFSLSWLTQHQLNLSTWQ